MFDDADSEASAFCFGADMLEERALAKTQAGFVAAHTGAEAAGEDADFVGRVDR